MGMLVIQTQRHEHRCQQEVGRECYGTLLWAEAEELLFACVFEILSKWREFIYKALIEVFVIEEAQVHFFIIFYEVVVEEVPEAEVFQMVQAEEADVLADSLVVFVKVPNGIMESKTRHYFVIWLFVVNHHFLDLLWFLFIFIKHLLYPLINHLIRVHSVRQFKITFLLFSEWHYVYVGVIFFCLNVDVFGKVAKL